MVRNENYWGTDEDGNQLPYLDEITLRGGRTVQRSRENIVILIWFEELKRLAPDRSGGE